MEHQRRSGNPGAAIPAVPRPGAGAPHSRARLVMHQRLFTAATVREVTDERGACVFRIDGRQLYVRGALSFADAQGQEVYRIQEPLLRARDTMRIYRGTQVAARVHNALFTPLPDCFLITVVGGSDLTTAGHPLYWEYTIERDGVAVAEISRRWLHGPARYGVEVAPSEDALLILAITAVIDTMAHEGS